MDDPRCPISVAENDARVEYELIRWQIIGGRQRRGAPARISQLPRPGAVGPRVRMPRRSK